MGRLRDGRCCRGLWGSAGRAAESPRSAVQRSSLRASLASPSAPRAHERSCVGSALTASTTPASAPTLPDAGLTLRPATPDSRRALPPASADSAVADAGDDWAGSQPVASLPAGRVPDRDLRLG